MSLSSVAFERIHHAILSGALDLGERLSEVPIADALGMSKAPVRMAFAELRDMGLVTIVPQAGTYVFAPSTADVFEMSSFRAVLETSAVDLAMARDPHEVVTGLDSALFQMRAALHAGHYEKYGQADREFHQTFLKSSGNSYLIRANMLTSSAIEALRVRLQSGEGNFREQSFDEHNQIRDLLASGDIAAAKEALTNHIMVINSYMKELPAPATVRSRSNTRSPSEYRDIFSRN
ncbi:GntR family transcriptional regulator [Qingshengfaniella alkalisoli]|uniref:GntR family transcriptional regulator n=1 Tax=Qingshengfaniella alkalisoli TaxID=2599296 RepID=A0A5B8J045_9RHOB|nr:GntR family transcriptional regulator [Qingshengfaniella alkalisoli]QDY70561.1 GntR family transcriptional regulator [Qingshengfaniella alkalisoli]